MSEQKRFDVILGKQRARARLREFIGKLFRRFNVRVTGHGTDEHGAWWSVENCGGAA